MLLDLSKIPDQVARQITATVWAATKFLAGSVSKEIPYEIVYGLKLALDDWNTARRKFAITTALLAERNFYFQRIDVVAYRLIDAFLKLKFDEDLIQIALPRIYRHAPLQAVPLYHELGHFVDSHNQITEYSLLRFPPDANPAIPPTLSAGAKALPQHVQLNVHLKHRQEMFADLFAAGYTGKAYVAALSDIGHGLGVSGTHPATSDRVKLLETYLTGTASPVVNMFNTLLTEKGLPDLKVRYQTPDVKDTFGNIRPHRIGMDSEVHGILSAGLSFINSLEAAPPDPWKGLSVDESNRIANDLIERSIRNRMFEKAWSSGITS